MQTAILFPACTRKPTTLIEEKRSSGFPSTAFDYADKPLDLNEHLITHPASTFFITVIGDSMISSGIHSKDLLIVDRSIRPSNNSIVLAVVNDEFTLKRFRKQDNKGFLVSDNYSVPPIEIIPGMSMEIWGVITHVIHRL